MSALSLVRKEALPIVPVVTKKQVDAAMASYDWEADRGEIDDILREPFIRIAVEQGEKEAQKLDSVFSEKDPFTQRHFTSYLGKRISQLSDTSREWVTEQIHTAIDAGKSVAQLADTILSSGAFSPARAQMIARTEVATAYNVGSLTAFRQAGHDEVDVSDGDGDEACADADGQVWTIEEALAEPLEHPGCVRSFSAHLEDD